MLRLWSAGRFELAASDPLGRALWRLRVDDGRGAFRDAAREADCGLDPSTPLLWPALGVRLRPSDLPAVLLGRLPEPVATEIGADRTGAISQVDSLGRSWQIALDARGLASWRLDGEGQPISWTRESAGGRLVVGASAVEIRWKEVARERLHDQGTPSAPTDPTVDPPECALESLS